MITDSFVAPVRESVDIVVSSFSFLPTILIALVILFIGWVIGSVLRKGVESTFLSMSFIDNAISKSIIGDTLAKAQIKIRIGVFFGVLIEIFVVLVSALIAFDVLGMESFSKYIQTDLLGYLPNIFSAVVVLVIGGLVATFIRKFVNGIGKVANLEHTPVAASVSQWAIWIFTILIAVSELGIAVQIINSIVFGLITAFTIAFGLAFGLGGQDAAADIIRKVREEIRPK